MRHCRGLSQAGNSVLGRLFAKHECLELVDYTIGVFIGIARQASFLTGLFQELGAIPAIFSRDLHGSTTQSSPTIPEQFRPCRCCIL
jgi:hypothetical protein